MEAHGVTGLEVGGGNLKSRVEEINKALQGRNIKASAICAGFSGFILAEDEQKQQFDTTMREIVEAAGLFTMPPFLPKLTKPKDQYFRTKPLIT